MAAPDTSTLLAGILGVVQRTEKHVAQINKSIQSSGDSGDSGGVATAAKGSTGGSSKKGNAEIVERLDTIIEVLQSMSKGNNGAGLGKIAIAVSSMANSLGNFTKAEKGGNLFLCFLDSLSEKMKVFGDKQVTQGVKNVALLSEVIVGFAGKLLAAGLILIPVMPLLPVFVIVLTGMGWAMTKLGESAKEINKGIKVVENVGVAMMFLAGGIATLTLSMVLSSLVLSKSGFPAGAVGVIAGMGLLMVLMGSVPAIRRGVRVLKNIGAGMLFLAGGIAILTLSFALSAVLMKSTGVGGMLGAGFGIISAIGGLAAMMFLMGLPPVKRGANTMKGIGLGFIAIAGGIAILGLTFALIGKLFGISPLEVGGAIALAMLGTAAVMIFMGKMSSNILKGSLAIAIMGLGFIVFGYGLQKTMDTLKGKTWEDIGKLGTATLGLALVVTLIGNPYTLTFTLLGSLALAAIGGGLASLAYGMKEYMNLGGFKFDFKKFEDTMRGIRDGFMVLLGDDDKGGGGGIIGALKSLGTSFVGGSKLAMAVGNAAGIGAALSSMAKGVGAWANLQNIPLISGYDKDGMPIYTGQNVDVDTALKQIDIFIGDGKTKGILVPFIKLSEAAGVTKSGGFSLMKLVTGNDLNNSPFYSGLRSSVKIGEVLTSIAEGIGTWANLQNIPLISGYDKEGKPIYTGENADVDKALSQIDTFIGDGETKGILAPFVKISNIAGVQKSGFSLTKLIVGNDAGNTPFYSGISAAVKIGKVLTSIAEGVGTWANLQNIPLISGYDDNGNPVYSGKADVQQALDQITSFIGDGEKTGILAVFTKFTDKKESSGFSLMKMVTGNDLSKTPLQRGISNALKIGKVLSSIGEGVGTWANLQNIPLIVGYDDKGNAIYQGFANIDVAIANIKQVLEEIPQSFIEVAGEPQPAGGLKGWLGLTSNPKASALSRGVSAIAPLGDVLTSLAQGINTFANLQNIKIIETYRWDEKAQRNVPVYSKDSIDITQAIDNAAYTITSLGDALVNVAGEPQESGGLMGWLGATKNPKATSITRAAKALAPVGDLLAGLAEGINTFANITNIKVIETYEWNEKAQRNVPKYSKDSINVTTAIDNAAYTITSLGDALANVAGEPQESGGLMGWIGATKNPKATSISRAAKALAPVGDLLAGLAQGINTFANLENIKIIETYEWNEKAQINVPKYSTKSVDVRTAIDNAAYTIEALGDALVNVAGEPESKGGLMGWLGMTKNPKATSISRAAKALAPVGDLLAGLAEGIQTFANLENIKLIETYEWKESAQRNVPVYSKKSVNVKSAIDNAAYTIEALGDALVKVAGEPDDSGLFGWLGMTRNPKATAISRAAKALAPVGDLLGGLAEGINTFANITNIKIIESYEWNEKAQRNVPVYSKKSVDIKTVAQNVTDVITILADGLSKLVPDVETGWRGSFIDLFLNSPDRKLRKATAMLSGLGEPLSALASAIETFANIENIITITGYDKNGKPEYGPPVQPAKVAENIVSVIDIITSGLAELVPDVPTGKGAGDLFNIILNSPNAKIRRAVGAVSGIGEALSALGEGFKIFADLSSIPTITGYDKEGKPEYGEPTDVTKVADNIKNIVLTTFNVLDEVSQKSENKAFGGMTGIFAFQKFTDDLIRLSKVANDFENFSKSFGVMATGMGRFTTEFKKMSPSSIKDFTLWTKSLTDFAKLNTVQFEQKLLLIKKTFGNDEENPADDMNNTMARPINFHKPKDDTKDKKKDEMIIQSLNMMAQSINNLSAKLSGRLNVRVTNTVATKEVE